MSTTDLPIAPTSIDADFLAYIDQHRDRAYELHAEHMNPAFVKMLRAIGFDKKYVTGVGCWLWDEAGEKYLDLLTGWIKSVASVNPMTALFEAGRGFISGAPTEVVLAFAAALGLTALFALWAIRGLRLAESAG